MSQAYDLNEAQPNTFELIPDGTQAPIILKFITGEPSDDLHVTNDGRARQAKLEVHVTAGPCARRRFWLNLMMVTNDPADEGHKKAIDISKSLLRAIVEAVRGFSPTDETPAAVAARKLKVADLDQMECTVIIGIEKGKNGYNDKNVIRRVVPHGKATAANGGGYDAGKEAASMRSATPAGASAKKW